MDKLVRLDWTAEASTAESLVTQPIPQIEKFNVAELTSLRNQLLRSGLDSWQAAQAAGIFLAGHGYGSNPEDLREWITGMELSHCSIDCLQAELERIAFVQ